jgi:hypothetical protein
MMIAIWGEADDFNFVSMGKFVWFEIIKVYQISKSS